MTRSRYVWCLVLPLLFVAGCWNPFSMFRSSPRAPKKSKKYHNWKEKTVIKPRLVHCGNCKKTTVVNEETKSLEVTYKGEEEEAKLSWWQRTFRWIGNLGTFGIVLIIAGLILFPGATVGFLIRWARRSAGALRQVVKAVKEADVVHGSDALHDSLSSNLTRTSKELVGRIKAQL